MKKLILILFLIINTITLSQSPVFNTLKANYYQPGAYYKDANNEMNKYVGTWLYTNGNTSFKLILQKRTMQVVDDYYRDIIIGGYHYIENGVEKVNWLNDINVVHSYIQYHKVTGGFFKENLSYPICDTCLPNERRLAVRMSEPYASGREYAFRFILGVTNPDKIEIQSMGRDIIVRGTNDPPEYYTLPLNMDITLTRVP